MFVCSVPKISQVLMKWRRRDSLLGRFTLGTSVAELHNSVDLLCGTTDSELHNSVNLLCGTTDSELHNSVNLLCGTTDSELHNSVNLLFGTTAAELLQPGFSDACTKSRTHFPKTGTNNAEKYEGSIQSKIKSKLLKDNALKIQQTKIDSRPSANS